MEDCALKAVREMIEKMKEEIAKVQKIPYPEQIVVAEIYNVVARILCEACKRQNLKKESCRPEGMKKEDELTMDAYILLKQLKDDGLISEDYYEKLFEGLIKIKPELEEQVREDRAKGLI
ncbi:MAG: hypothetical protein QXL86_02630 [Candidatus Aenigmatarchaeota archaeon]